MSLPSILAGPILRRAEPGSVSVWLATSFDPGPGVELRLFTAGPAGSIFPRIPTTSSFTTVRAGASVFISLVTAVPDAPPPRVGAFPTNTLLGYEVWLTGSGISGERVLLADVDEDYSELIYDGTPMPTFYLQEGERLVLAHGSCRKPHGDGTDAMPAADTLIGRRPRDLETRPCMLCLTGDQIYSNSPHGNVLGQIQSVRAQLFGYDEHVPTPGGATRLDALSDIARRSKRPAVAKAAGLNPDDWPLFGVGEMVSMYFLAWHGALWAGHEKAPLAAGNKAPLAIAKRLKGREQIKRFVSSLPAVRRAMANAATYMIFDDHEVTDDWNLYKEWKARVLASDLGRRVVTNALVAYWLCQGWGNDPSRFDATFVTKVSDYCDLLRTSAGNIPAASGKPFDDFFWNFQNWAFVTPTTPPVFFLDTRTRRELYPRGRAPRLLTAEAWRSFIAESRVKGSPASGSETARVTLRPGDPLVIVAPTPVFGMLFTEAKDKRDCLDDGPEGPDFEHWRFNQQAHHDFIKGLIDRFAPRFGVFLSGDVHASFTAEVDYILRAEPVGPDGAQSPSSGELASATRFYQFTSSPLLNQNEDLGGQIDTTRLPASEVLLFWYGIAMVERWDLVGYDRLWRDRAIQALQKDPELRPIAGLIPRRLYVQLHDGRAPDDPFVTPTGLVAHRLQSLAMGRPLWREVGSYFRHFKKDSDDAPMFPYNNIGCVVITPSQVIHEICVVKDAARLLPPIRRYQYVSKPPR